MAKKASLTISAPPKGTTFLEITCYRQGTDPRPGDLTLTVEANGKIIGKRSISNAEGESTLKYFIQPFPIQDQKTNIVLEIDRSFSYKDDPREFGLVLGTVQWK